MTSAKKPASRKARSPKARKEPVDHPGSHSSSDHHKHSNERPERRAHPRGDDIFTKIQDATEKVLRQRKHEIKK